VTIRQELLHSMDDMLARHFSKQYLTASVICHLSARHNYGSSFMILVRDIP